MPIQLNDVSEMIKAFLHNQYPEIIVRGISADGTLFLESLGDCAGCPPSCMAAESEMLDGITKMFPEISRLSITPAISEETIAFAKQLLGIAPEV